MVKREQVSTRSTRGRRSATEENHDPGDSGEAGNDDGRSSVLDRRALRSRYLNVKSRISDERDDLFKVDSNALESMIKLVDNLHNQVEKPREQVADAEALLDITNTLATSVQAHSSDGLTPSDFVSSLLRNFALPGGPSTSADDAPGKPICWKDIGHEVSHLFRCAPGFPTMLGPMDTEIKQRKVSVRRKRARPTESSRPEDLDKAGREEKTDTDKNMATMFAILKRNKRNRGVRLENLILNRKSFAQTVENLFALSFLVRDGRVEVSVDETGAHLVSPKNSPAAAEIHSGEVSYRHFVFRFDFSDWKLMMTCVEDGDEFMPHRETGDMDSDPQPDPVRKEGEDTLQTTPIRKLSRNRGRVLQEQQTVVEDSAESDDSAAAARAAEIRKGKRKLI